jgi:hypothetical protein
VRISGCSRKSRAAATTAKAVQPKSPRRSMSACSASTLERDLAHAPEDCPARRRQFRRIAERRPGRRRRDGRIRCDVVQRDPATRTAAAYGSDVDRTLARKTTRRGRGDGASAIGRGRARRDRLRPSRNRLRLSRNRLRLGRNAQGLAVRRDDADNRAGRELVARVADRLRERPSGRRLDFVIDLFG